MRIGLDESKTTGVGRRILVADMSRTMRSARLTTKGAARAPSSAQLELEEIRPQIFSKEGIDPEGNALTAVEWGHADTDETVGGQSAAA